MILFQLSPMMRELFPAIAGVFVGAFLYGLVLYTRYQARRRPRD